MKIEAHKKILLVAIVMLLFVPLLAHTAHGDDSIPEFKLTAGIHAVEFDQFGYSVDIHGDTAVVGAPFADSVYVFQYDESTSAWSEDPVAVLTAPVPAGPGQFGWSVAIDGDTVVVGALDLMSYIGSAYVFIRTGGTWNEGHQLTLGAGVGASVAISGDTLVVGAIIPASSAYVFRYVYDDSTGTWDWVQNGQLTAPGASFAPFFGWSVAIDGDTAVVGAPFLAKAAYVYTRSGDTWDEGSELATGDWVGSSVAVSGDTVVVAAPSYTSFPLNSPIGPGSVSLFTRSGDTWTTAGILNSEASGFGASVAISGNRLVVGAPRDNDDGKLSGSTYMFTYDGDNWVADSSLPKLSPSVAPPAEDSDQFGRAVAIDSSTVLVGAVFGDDPVTIDAGSASVFILPSPNQPPIARAEASPDEVKEGELFTLDGSASEDPDGDPLIYNWVQIDGPEVESELASVLAANFNTNTAVRELVAPELSDGCDTLVFQLTVTEDREGGLTSDAVTVEIEVLPNNTIYAKLGGRHHRWLDLHKYSFYGHENDEVTIKLEADPNGWHRGGKATLILKDKIKGARLFETNRGSLPNYISATLPADGTYTIYVLKQPWFWSWWRHKRFEGGYILSLEGTCGKLVQGSKCKKR